MFEFLKPKYKSYPGVHGIPGATKPNKYDDSDRPTGCCQSDEQRLESAKRFEQMDKNRRNKWYPQEESE